MGGVGGRGVSRSVAIACIVVGSDMEMLTLVMFREAGRVYMRGAGRSSILQGDSKSHGDESQHKATVTYRARRDMLMLLVKVEGWEEPPRNSTLVLSLLASPDLDPFEPRVSARRFDVPHYSAYSYKAPLSNH